MHRGPTRVSACPSRAVALNRQHRHRRGRDKRPIVFVCGRVGIGEGGIEWVGRSLELVAPVLDWLAVAVRVIVTTSSWLWSDSSMIGSSFLLPQALLLLAAGAGGAAFVVVVMAALLLLLLEAPPCSCAARICLRSSSLLVPGYSIGLMSPICMSTNRGLISPVA